MIVRRSLIVFLRAGVPVILIAAALSNEGTISVQTWIGAAAMWIGGVLLWDFIMVAAIEPGRRVSFWRRSKRRRQHPTGFRPSGRQAVNLLLSGARTNPRVHENALRPRLISLAEHYIPSRHGLNLEHDQARVAVLLGDVAWLIDPAVGDRAPTTVEIGRFLDIILAGRQMPGSLHNKHRVAEA